MVKDFVLDLKEIEVLAKKHFGNELSVRDGRIRAMDMSEIQMLELRPKDKELKGALPVVDGMVRCPILREFVVDNMYSVDYLAKLFSFLKNIGASHVRFIMKDTAPIVVRFNVDCVSSVFNKKGEEQTVALVGTYFLAPRVENTAGEFRSDIPEGFIPCESLRKEYATFEKEKVSETTTINSTKNKKGKKRGK